MDDIFGEADVIFKYTRKQALEDGVLVDISELAKEAGIKFPVAVTQGVFSVLNETSSPGQDLKGRAWDLLMVFRMTAKSSKGDEIHFAPLFVMPGNPMAKPVRMWAKCGPGDEMEPCVTIMLEGED
ncbi:MAG TPA: hypothetical protein PLO78_05295 [Candidatus Omnitrophota bacterium]|nr:hypothetical protein [Candidatus Omnitrophota bacterium]